MSGNILFGGAGNTQAKDFGEQDATITNVSVSVSPKYTTKLKDGREVPKIDLQVDWRGDDGKTVRCFYGGLYADGSGNYTFGKMGKARALVTRWSESTGRTPQGISDLIGSRVRVAPQETEFGGKTSWKLKIVGPARNATAPAAAAPTNAAALFAAPAPVAATPVVDGAAAYNALPADIKSFLPNAVKSNGDERTADALKQGGFVKGDNADATARAIVAHVKTLSG